MTDYRCCISLFHVKPAVGYNLARFLPIRASASRWERGLVPTRSGRVSGYDLAQPDTHRFSYGTLLPGAGILRVGAVTTGRIRRERTPCPLQRWVCPERYRRTAWRVTGGR